MFKKLRKKISLLIKKIKIKFGKTFLVGYPSIKRFRNVVASIDHYFVDELGQERPQIRYVGTVKIHGTNTSVVRFPNGTIQAQSKRTILSKTADQNGFYKFAFTTVGMDTWARLFTIILRHNPHWADRPIAIYMEFAGKGIQKGHAIHKLSKRAFIFAATAGCGLDHNGHSTTDTEWLDLQSYDMLEAPEHNVFNIENFYSNVLTINFGDMGNYHERMKEYYKDVEEGFTPEEPIKPLPMVMLEDYSEIIQTNCPVGKTFGIEGYGEGIVWKADDPQIPKNYMLDQYNFKIVPHSSKIAKTSRPTITVSPEKMKSIEEFADKVLTQTILVQGVSFLTNTGKELSKKSTGIFLNWILDDIKKEESDTLEESGLTLKDVQREITDRAKIWFFKQTL